jgi:pimeloyl-ACP methyl ester carboxylesterase
MIHALPGTGADQRMFPDPWGVLPGFVAHDWTAVRRARSLPELAAAVTAEWNIRDGDSLVGCSLGGMVACEIARLRRIHCLFLVGSATHRAEVNPWLTTLCPLIDLTPLNWMKLAADKLPGEVAAMFAASDPDFVRAMCKAIFLWSGLGETATRVFRIHGRLDRVIPPPAQVDLLLEGGHLVAMTHAELCADFVGKNLG